MKALLAVFPVVVLTACSTGESRPAETDPRVEETQVYLQTVKPDVVSWVGFQEPLRFEVVSNMHAILESDGVFYLLETERMCRDLTSRDIYSDMADRRSMRGRLRSGIDTLRGCTIETIYRLPPSADSAAEDETTAEESGPTTTQEPK